MTTVAVHVPKRPRPRLGRWRLLVGLGGLPRRRLVGVDDLADQRMPDDVPLVEPDHAHRLQPAQLAHRVRQPRRHAGRQVGLGRIAGDDHTGVLAHAGEEHLHLRRRGVLRLVEDDQGVAQRPAAHVGQGCDLDLARLDPLLQLALRQHVLQRVVERPHIGIDLLLQVARQEAQPLAGLDRRPRQDDPLDPALLQQRHRHGDGEIGLAGAGRPQREDQVVAVEGAQIGRLIGRARP